MTRVVSRGKNTRVSVAHPTTCGQPVSSWLQAEIDIRVSRVDPGFRVLQTTPTRPTPPPIEDGWAVTEVVNALAAAFESSRRRACSVCIILANAAFTACREVKRTRYKTLPVCTLQHSNNLSRETVSIADVPKTSLIHGERKAIVSCLAGAFSSALDTEKTKYASSKISHTKNTEIKT